MMRARTATVTATLLSAGCLASSVWSAPASAQSTCDWYARTAVKQQQENEQKKCGFKGPDWSSDVKAHATWCAGVPADVWRELAQKRDRDLASCVRK